MPEQLTQSAMHRQAAPSSTGNAAPDLPISEPDNTEKLIVIALFLLAVACYANTLMNGFVYDDDQQILLNPYIKSWHYLPQIFTTTVWSFVGAAGATNYYRPMMTFTFLVLWQTFGDLPFGYHLFNIVLNALVVLAVYYAGRELFRDRSIAAIAAFLFAVHPIHTETVCWIAAVPDLEATLFLLVAFRAYTNISSTFQWKQLLVVISFLVALLAKEPALMLAPMLVLYEHFVRDDHQHSTFTTKLGRYFPVCAAAVAYLACRILLLGKLAPVLQHAQISWPQAIFSAFALVGQYTRLLLRPSHLSAFHTFHVSNTLWDAPVLAGIAIVLGSLVFILLCYKKFPALTFSLVWIGFTLGPVLNARWMASNVLAERYLYLPSVGFCWIAAWSLSRCWDAVKSKEPWRMPARVALAVLMAAIVLAGAIKTFARNNVWHDDITLYTTTLRTDPDSYVMHLNLGTSYFQNRNFPDAEKELKQALVLKPDSVNALNALGCLYLEQERLDESARMFQSAIELKPLWTDPHYNFGRLLVKTGHRPEALEQFRTAVETGPLNSSARLFLAQTLAEDGNLQEAETEYRKSLELAPTIDADRGLIDVLLRTGRSAEAEDRMRALLKQYPFEGAMHLKLAKQLEIEGRNEEALQEYRSALETDGQNTEIKSAIARLSANH
jgi:Tfp pilus assembly protein PilF